MKRRVCITGATGTMGMATLREFATRDDRFIVTVLARPSKINRKKLAAFPNIHIVWGNLCELADVKRAVEEADYVLHLGGMVSPAADRYPEQTLKVNVKASENVAQAVMEGGKADTCKVVYVGSVAELGDRRPPLHWGRAGDPISPSRGNYYAVSKAEAERVIVESGLKNWLVLRQSGILYPGLLFKGKDPIAFHVPLRGLLEWATDEDSGRLMANICESDVPERLWNKFYNIGSGETYRLTNYEFEKLLLKALGCPPPEKVFEANWFATQNFHGQWYLDSDRLEELVHFRSGESCEEYFARMKRKAPWYFRLAPLAPAFLIKAGMKLVAKGHTLGTLWWMKHDITHQINIHFGSKEQWRDIPSWDVQLPELADYPAGEPRGKRTPKGHARLDHGFDESKATLTIEDMRQKATFNGGKCLSTAMTPGDMHTKLEWQCGCGERFWASPTLILHGGHWCPVCLRKRLE